MSEWQPMETAPLYTEVLLAYVRHGKWEVKSATKTDHVHGEGIWSWCVDDNKFGPYPIHGYVSETGMRWMPLPEPPK